VVASISCCRRLIALACLLTFRSALGANSRPSYAAAVNAGVGCGNVSSFNSEYLIEQRFGWFRRASLSGINDTWSCANEASQIHWLKEDCGSLNAPKLWGKPLRSLTHLQTASTGSRSLTGVPPTARLILLSAAWTWSRSGSRTPLFWCRPRGLCPQWVRPRGATGRHGAARLDSNVRPGGVAAVPL